MTVSNVQPSIVLHKTVQETGLYPPRDSGGGGTSYIGAIRTYAAIRQLTNNESDGETISISSNTALFSILGTTFGGNGTTNFMLPDLSDRLSVHAGQGPGLSYRQIGQAFGSDTVFLNSFMLPPSEGGQGQPVSNMEEMLVTNWVINLDGFYPTRDGELSQTSIGVVSQFAGNFAPAGTAFCDGQLLSISQYTALFSVIGTTYGGDGITTFALPDLRGRTPVGAGNGFILGQKLGVENIYLTDSNLPAELGGSSAPVSNYAPSLVLNNLIITQGVFPSSGRDFDGEYPMMSEVLFFAGTYTNFSNAMTTEGQLLSINTNQALFALIGNAYGGDGITTFALPNTVGRSILGYDGDYAIGTTLGSDSFAITLEDLPALNLTVNASTADLRGGNLADTLNGDDRDNVLAGRDGNDTLIGAGGNDRLNGGPGADTMRGGTGDDTYLVENAGDLVVELPDEGTDFVYSLIDYTLPDNVEDLRLLVGALVGTGNELANDIAGNRDDNVLTGGGGGDTLSGFNGNDTIQGDAGDDVIFGGAGSDMLYGGADNDEIDGGPGKDQIWGGTGLDILSGGSGHDTIHGGEDADSIDGGAGVDTLNGDGGNDIILGGFGRDTIDGGDGDDTIEGGAAADYVTGGSGADTFVFGVGDFVGNGPANIDIITDFSQAEGDLIDLSAVASFAFVGEAEFSGTGAELRYVNNGGLTFLYGDIDGDGAADFGIRILQDLEMQASDFVL